MLQCTGLNREGRDVIIWGECDTEISGFDDDFSGLLGIAYGVFRDAFVFVNQEADDGLADHAQTGTGGAGSGRFIE